MTEPTVILTGTLPPAITPDVRFVSYVMVTDTRTFEIIKRTAKSLTLRNCRRGDVLDRENRDGNPYPVVWTEAVSDPDGPTRVVRLRSDGTYRVADSASPLRPAVMIKGKPAEYTDYRF